MVVKYKELVEEIRKVSGLPDADSAARAAAATMGALSHVLPAADRERMADLLPGKLRNSMEADARFAPSGGRRVEESGFVAEVAGRCGCTPQQARLRAHATLATLAAREGENLAKIRLPDWFDDLVNSPDPYVGVVAAATKAPPLTEEEVRVALTYLPHWTGDRRQLVRSVGLPPENADRVRRQVERTIDASHRHGVVQPIPDGVRITLQTESAQAITPDDVDLARRIEQTLTEVGTVVDPSSRDETSR
jgi:uncharacterized protein (DUF2267 family)/pterin-4a-carbinolamine dehydratase